MLTFGVNTNAFVGRTDSVHPTVELLDFYFTILHVAILIKGSLSNGGKLLFEDLTASNRNTAMFKLRISTGT